MSAQPNYITPAGFKKLQDELLQLLHKERPEIVKTVAWAAGNGDRSENADYIYGKRRMREIDRRIRFLQTRLDAAVVVNPEEQTTSVVKFGAIVTIVDEDDRAVCYQIVGIDETQPEAGLISWQSPLARSLLGKKEGDIVLVRRPKGDIEYEIKKISYG